MASVANAFIKPFVSIGVSIRTHSKLQKCSLEEYPRVAKFLDEVERLTVNQDVTGSSPVTGAKTDKSEPLRLGFVCLLSGKAKLWDKYSDLAIKNIIILFKWIYLYIPALKSVISCELLLFCSPFPKFGAGSVFCVYPSNADTCCACRPTKESE